MIGELHGMDASYNCFGINALIAHLKLDVKLVPVGFGAEGLETKTPEFIAMNPHHTIPTYKRADGWSLWESTAILRHFARIGGVEFLGRTEEERSKVDLVLGWKNDHLPQGTSLIYFPLGFAPAPKENIPECQEKYLKALDILVNSGHLMVGDSFAAGGDKITIADFALWPALYCVWKMKVCDFPEKVASYLKRCETACPAMVTARAAFDGYSDSKLNA